MDIDKAIAAHTSEAEEWLSLANEQYARFEYWTREGMTETAVWFHRQYEDSVWWSNRHAAIVEELMALQMS